MLVDLVDGTRVVELLGDRRASELFSCHDRMARELIERFDGVEIDKTDGFFLLFSRPAGAVAFAVAYHGALGRLSSRIPELPALHARVGIHRGKVYVRENAPARVVTRELKTNTPAVLLSKIGLRGSYTSDRSTLGRR